jgi:hypothetical protein
MSQQQHAPADKQRGSKTASILFSSFIFAIGLLFLFAIACMIKGYVEEHNLVNRLSKSGVPAEATVIRAGSESSEESVAYYLIYQYDVVMSHGDTVTLTRRENLPRGMFNELRDQTTINIRYDPEEPDIARIDGHRPNFFNTISVVCLFTPFMLFLLWGGGYLLVKSFRM